MKVIGGVLLMALLLGFSPDLSRAQDRAQEMRDLRVAFLSRRRPHLWASRRRRNFPGSASLYTTATFGIVGGDAHESVRAAAKRFVAAAEPHHDKAVVTRDHAYPQKGKIRFYLRTFHDLRIIETDAASAYSTSGPYSSLFRHGQAVLTELRKVVEANR